MGGLTKTVAVLFLLAAAQATAGGPVFTVVDPDGAAGRVAAPTSVQIDLTTLFDGKVDPDRLRLNELNAATGQPLPAPVPVQFVPDSKGSTKGNAVVDHACGFRR